MIVTCVKILSCCTRSFRTPWQEANASNRKSLLCSFSGVHSGGDWQWKVVSRVGGILSKNSRYSKILQFPVSVLFLGTFRKKLVTKLSLVLTDLAARDEILAGSGGGVAGFDHGVNHCDAAAAELGRADVHEGAAVSRDTGGRVSLDFIISIQHC